MMGMQAAARPMCMPGQPDNSPDLDKNQRIREKLREIFGREVAISDALLSRRYTITRDGDLVMIVR
jgi:hypothetical protein